MPTRTSSDGGPDPPERGWVPSPGQWTAPEGKRAGKDWIPPGGAVERLDRMAWWVRAWSRPLLRAVGLFEEWLWEHGGYDVEGPDATLERERLSARYKVQDALMKAALDHPGPWPVQSTVRTQNVEVLDVDRYKDLAVVTAAIAEDPNGDGPVLNANIFRWEEGGSRALGGGGSRSGPDPLLARQEWRENNQAIRVSSKGWHGPRERGGSTSTCDATLLCSPAVSSLTVERPSDVVWSTSPRDRAGSGSFGPRALSRESPLSTLPAWSSPLWSRASSATPEETHAHDFEHAGDSDSFGNLAEGRGGSMTELEHPAPRQSCALRDRALTGREDELESADCPE